MPAVTTTAVMVLTNVGLQLFNNWRNNQTSDEMRRRQQEFQRAAQDRNHDRMLQLLRAGQAMQEQLETKNHKQRIKNINEDFDNLIKRTFHAYALKKWPLEVLPMVMKNQSLGSFSSQSDENIALHVILTPSNSRQFNDVVYPQIALGVEAFCNRHWNSLSDHPIIFYNTDAWRSGTAPKQTEIDQLKTDLEHLPILLITPFFSNRDGLVFKINMWGMGKRQTNRNDEQFDINYTEMVIQPTEQEFSYYNLYATDTNYGDELSEVTIDEFVPYLQCMIGYLSDVYFWSAHNRTPILPTLLSIGALQISYKQRNNLIEGYANLFQSNLALLNEIPTDSRELTILSNYLLSTSNILDKTLFQKQLENLYLCACEWRGYTTNDIQKAIVYTAKNNIFLPTDTDFLKQFAVLHKVETKVKKAKNHYKMKTLNATEYSEKRDELLGLIDQVLKVDGIKDGEMETFLATQKRLQENQFNIVLIGEFQGGKSTTFNALCGGREISPRGAMNKTSAICITATNLSDSEAKEYAIVRWKTPSELLQLMDRFISTITAEDLGVPIKEDEMFSIYQHFSFENPKHIEVLRHQIEEQESFLDCELDKQQDFNEVLRIAKLIIAFANNKTIIEIQKQNQYAIEDIAKFAVFPNQWEEHWTKIKSIDDVSVEFTVEEVIFAFVSDISCHIHCANLARLGCSVTDCPGLFASSWDTSVALNAISQANAVIYLLGGSKQMGQGDEKAITMIFRQKSLSDKIFFAINKKDNDIVTENIIRADSGILKNLGISDASIWDFNALLFFLSEFGQTILSGSIDEFTKVKFMDVAKRNGYMADSIEGNWKKMIQRIGVALDNDQLLEVRSMTQEAIHTLRKVSSAEVLLTTINDSIITKKAESILISNGANKVKETLVKIEARLKNTEEDALRTVEQCEAEYQSALQAFDSFKEKVHTILSNAFPEYLSHQLAQNGYIEITSPTVIDAIALRLAIDIPKALNVKSKGNAIWHKIMEKIANGKTEGWSAEQRDKASRELQNALEPVVTAAVQEELAEALKLWQNALNDGTHNDYVAYILPKLEETVNKINEAWNQIASANPLVEGFSIPSIPLETSIKDFNLSRIYSDGGVDDAVVNLVLADIVRQIIAHVVSTIAAAIVIVTVHFLLDGGLGLIPAFLAYLSTLFGLNSDETERAQTRDDLKKKQKKIYDALRPILGDTFQNTTTRENTIEKLVECPNNIFKWFKGYYVSQLKQQAAELQQSIDTNRRYKEQSLERQQEIAVQAKQIRETQIEPLTLRVSAFMEDCYMS